jgi:urease accessory protein
MSETFRAVAYQPPGIPRRTPYDIAVLRHDERRVRRRVLPLVHGDQVFVDFPAAITLADRGALELDDGRVVEVIAAEEPLYEISGEDDIHLMRLCWHLGNRHLKTQIVRDSSGRRLLILRDHVIGDMLHGLGARVREVLEPFEPEEGAYAHGHGDQAHALLNR